jgi:hypothetical protein
MVPEDSSVDCEDPEQYCVLSVKLHWMVLKSLRSSELPVCRSQTQ